MPHSPAANTTAKLLPQLHLLVQAGQGGQLAAGVVARTATTAKAPRLMSARGQSRVSRKLIPSITMRSWSGSGERGARRPVRKKGLSENGDGSHGYHRGPRIGRGNPFEELSPLSSARPILANPGRRPNANHDGMLCFAS